MAEAAGSSVRERLEQALAACRPFLQADGGDVTLVRICDDGVAEVMFHGTCVVCPMSRMTLRAGLERFILKRVPELRRIESVTR